MNNDKNAQPQAEQLLKLLEGQIAASRARRAAPDSSRSKAGLIGVILIVGGAAFALWMLMAMLEQMRPQHGGQPVPVGEVR